MGRRLAPASGETTGPSLSDACDAVHTSSAAVKGRSLDASDMFLRETVMKVNISYIFIFLFI